MKKVVELTKENEQQYLNQVAELEETVLGAMIKEGRIGQLFTTGKEDISVYVHSDENTVLVMTDEDNNVEAATYITQGQKPFTYNDITKYFKYGEKYNSYVKAQYSSEEEYQSDMLTIYKIKIKAFEYARNRLLAEYSEMSSIEEYLQREINDNGFHEKSELREKINQYMSEYIAENYDDSIQMKYEQFYWITTADIAKEFGRTISNLNSNM